MLNEAQEIFKSVENEELEKVKEQIKLQNTKGITLEDAVRMVYLEAHGFEW